MLLKLSPSQDNNLYFCERQWYITYGLNYKSLGGKAANLGTTVHKVMELLALAKLHNQKTQEIKFLIKDKIIGQYEFNTETWLKSKNERKVGRSIYNIPGAEIIDELHSLVYSYYSNFHADQDWEEEDRKNTLRWVYTILHEKEGVYDVRQNNIVSPEQYLSYEIKEDWAAYDYGDGVKGNLRLTGIIDLIKCVDEEKGWYEIVDYKTGKRADWSTGEEKTVETLPFDTQLMFYFYFIHKLYPQFKHTFITIFYTKAGGPFTVPFEISDIPRIEKHIRKTFEIIKNMKYPRMRDESQRDYKCRKFCPYFVQQMDGTNLCRAVGDRIKLLGIEKTTEELRQK